MQFQIPIKFPEYSQQVRYPDKVMLVGSCFTEHIGDQLRELKFPVLQNPHGILFDPFSVAKSLRSYLEPYSYQESDLIQYNELWQSWDHHSRFSDTEAARCLSHINQSQVRAHEMLKQANWLVITLGSSFSYRLTDAALQPDQRRRGISGVANCHRAPSHWFQKYLMPAGETVSLLSDCLSRLQQFNPHLNVIFTISPVRHIRDGVIENNRSKARLIESVHALVQEFPHCYYFPAYELVIDVLRDYRFYDIDLAHPNYAATRFVMDHFLEQLVHPDSRQLSREILEIVTARKHKPFQPYTSAHQRFLAANAEKVRSLMARHPFLDLQEELSYFEGSASSE